MALIVHYTDPGDGHALVTVPDGEPRSRNIALGLRMTREAAVQVAEQFLLYEEQLSRYVPDEGVIQYHVPNEDRLAGA